MQEDESMNAQKEQAMKYAQRSQMEEAKKYSQNGNDKFDYISKRMAKPDPEIEDKYELSAEGLTPSNIDMVVNHA